MSRSIIVCLPALKFSFEKGGTIGVVAPELLHYITYLQNLDRYVGLAIWALGRWSCDHLAGRTKSAQQSIGFRFNPSLAVIPYQRIRPMVINKSCTRSAIIKSASHRPLNGPAQIVQGLFAITLGSFILSGEKLFVQVIARNFHKKSYEDRILVQKHDIGILVTLYANSHDIGRTDTMDHTFDGITLASSGRYIKKALRGVKKAAQTGATAIGTVTRPDYSNGRFLLMHLWITRLLQRLPAKDFYSPTAQHPW